MNQVTPASDPHPTEPAVRLTSVSKVYTSAGDRRTALSDVSLTVPRGQWIALVGRSGSGKSTLLNLLAGIDAPTHGEVNVLGVSLGRLGEADRTRFRRQQIGFVYQSFNLLANLTAEENLRLPLELNGVASREAGARAQTMLDALGLGDRGAAYPERLSGGEQQRIAIGRGLIHRPALLLADEPTGSLDDATGQAILELFQRLIADTGTTLLMVTHSRPLAEQAEAIHHLADGRLHPEGAPA